MRLLQAACSETCSHESQNIAQLNSAGPAMQSVARGGSISCTCALRTLASSHTWAKTFEHRLAAFTEHPCCFVLPQRAGPPAAGAQSVR